jgi:7-carboxy-7-deazaguanine synthase
MSNTLPVNEIFETIQGEATYTGTPAVFVRLQGCPVGCPWCDTKHTWEVEQDKEVSPTIMFLKEADAPTFSRFSVPDLIECLDQFQARHVVITGGEPCMYDLREHTKAIIDSGRTCQIETSGTFPIRIDDRCFVTLSPKLDMPGGLEVLNAAYLRANEVKYPLGKESDLTKIAERVATKMKHGCVLWLQPLSQSPKATALCVKAATEQGWKVSIQTHKFIGVR